MTQLTKGARNLVILGIASVLIAVTTTSISLAIYHLSGDIYLDRSRPGFLPSEEEISADESDGSSGIYTFSDSGAITPADVSEYRTHLQAEIDAIDAYDSPFSESALSDEVLGLPSD